MSGISFHIKHLHGFGVSGRPRPSMNICDFMMYAMMDTQSYIIM